jgi:hypothetical protein
MGNPGVDMFGSVITNTDFFSSLQTNWMAFVVLHGSQNVEMAVQFHQWGVVIEASARPAI